jgi:hypothetical protein
MEGDAKEPKITKIASLLRSGTEREEQRSIISLNSRKSKNVNRE